jgi:hypothetical protein
MRRALVMRRLLSTLLVVALGLLFAALGCGYTPPGPAIDVTQPAARTTTSSSIRIGGTIANASFVHVYHQQTANSVEGYVFYLEGMGTWFADVYGLVPGANDLAVIADRDGNGTRVSRVEITILRPEIPALLMVNGPDRNTTDTYWTDAHSCGGAHALALYADGTGRATTGSTLAEPAGPVIDVTWTLAGPERIEIATPGCSFAVILRITGSAAEGLAFGQVVTVGGAGVQAVDAFDLMAGTL